MSPRKKLIDQIIFCYTCKTDLRILNERYHEDCGHDVRRLDHHPHDERPIVPRPPVPPQKIIFGNKA